MNAPTLFDWRSTDPSTSIAAAPTAHRRNRWQLECLATLDEFADATAYEVWCDLQYRHDGRVPAENSVSKRLSDLHAYGQIAPTGERRLGGRGKEQIVWSITDAGRHRLAVER